jgi:hypothetical protein
VAFEGRIGGQSTCFQDFARKVLAFFFVARI